MTTGTVKKATAKKATVKKVAAKKTVTKKTTAKKAATTTRARRATPAKNNAPKQEMSQEARFRTIELEAFLLAEKDGFKQDATNYWLQAEKNVG